MNRREFGKSLAATTALPLIPTPTITATPAIKPIHLMWGETIARAQNGCTPAYLAKALKVPMDIAQSVHSHLMRTNVIRAGAVRGASLAVKPTFPKGGYRSGGSPILDQVKEIAKSAIKQPDPSAAPDAHPDQIDPHSHESSAQPEPDHTH